MTKRALLPVKLFSQWILLDAAIVKEVLGVQPWLTMPNASASVPGVLAWRGQAVPILNLGEILGISEARGHASGREPFDCKRILITHCGQDIIAIPITQAREVRPTPEEEVLRAHSINLPYSDQEVDVDGIVMPLVNLSPVVAELEGMVSGASN